MRNSRNLSTYTKQLISNSLKQYHAKKTEQAKLTTREKQRASMKLYWATIPQGEDITSAIKGCRTTSKIVQPIIK